MSRDPRPVCLVTGTVSPYRREPFRMLAAAEGVEVLAHEHPGPPVEGLTVRDVSQLRAARLAGSGRYRAVVCGLGGRLALPGSYIGARRAGVPFVLWATIWAHPRTPAHALSYLPTRHLYRHADAVVTYGRHVSAYVEARRGGRGNVFEAPQAVDSRLYGRRVDAAERAAARERCRASADGFLALFVGRLEREKGLEVLLDAWGQAELGPSAALALAGEGSLAGEAARAGSDVTVLGHVGADELPALYAAADVVVLPSIPTATFKEPWGLVVNEAMLQGTPIVASDAVGAVAGDLVRDGANGLVAPHGDSEGLATRIRAVAQNPDLRRRLGTAAARDVQAFTFAGWVDGVRAALTAVHAGRDQTSW